MPINILAEIISTSLTAAGLVGAGGWLFRKWIVARLTADISLENDSKLEQLKTKLQRTNATLSALNSAGSAAYSQSQVALLPHRIAAINSVWSSVLEWNQMATASMFVSVLPVEWIKQNASDPGTKKTFDALLGGKSYLDFLKKRGETELTRPLISERAWALYAAYSGLYFSRVSKAAMLAIPSLNHAEIWSRIDERALIKASAPPELLQSYDANVLQGTTAFLDYIKSELLKELRSDLSGSRDSEEALSNASTILAAATALVESSQEKPSATTLTR